MTHLERASAYVCMYVCVYIYIYAVKLLSGPSLGVFKVIIWAKSKLLSGPSLFSHYKNGGGGFRRFFFAQLSFCVFCVQLFANFLKIAFFFFRKNCAKIGFSKFLCFKLNF